MAVWSMGCDKGITRSEKGAIEGNEERTCETAAGHFESWGSGGATNGRAFSLTMPPKKNKNAKKAGRFKEEPEEVEEKLEQQEEDVEYDSDGNEIVKNKDEPEASSSDAAPGKLSAREIVKLKKKKQKGLLTEEELAQYADVLGVEERYALPFFARRYPFYP